ncbi:hypothetical protein L2E82_49302 [Cichorium intybus]|uniref:Uncharacterized protein n=1 Tax=Cichorium intybus TaxID=13427 RepID=A0ACB8Z031_CICIN|nr:hypothetical protein L2E82_49302 [Cichorium intybus]
MCSWLTSRQSITQSHKPSRAGHRFPATDYASIIVLVVGNNRLRHETKSILISQNGRLKLQDDAHVISTKKPISISSFFLKISRQIIEYPGFHLI